MTGASLRSRIVRLTAGLAGLTALWACNAPFIPVPPPATVFTAQLVSDGGGGQKTVWTTQGQPDVKAELAKFFLYDNERGAGVIVKANADGSYQSPAFDGTRGDHVYVYYQTPTGDDSEVACRQLIEGPDPAPDCSL
jgi:hypothetical protein